MRSDTIDRKVDENRVAGKSIRKKIKNDDEKKGYK